ncbi:hypothetical protein BGZ65_004648 [Modicella reniformis]|uniref:Disease resistance R13L4/SHOC-2-like LRR domain-containing protein n=1 Tax=Modicella reniformis TaxID=1440133 RepID=A0A9P6MGT4_9FUNG|nr:hypothetical protein BGZ65_004648 [Modicella reniformis]
MISSRKANPYYTGVIARFGNGGKHSLHDRELSSSSGRRKSLVSVGGERAKVGAEATTSKEKLSSLEQSKPSPTEARRPSITSSVSTMAAGVKDKVHQSMSEKSSIIGSTPSQLIFSTANKEEYGVEKNESSRNSARTSPYAAVNGNTLDAISSPASDPSGSRRHEGDKSQTKSDLPTLRIGVPTGDSAWSRATGAGTDTGTVPDSASSVARTDSIISHAMTSCDSEDSDEDDDETPSVSTLSSQMVQSYREQGVIITEDNWDDEDLQIGNISRVPTLYIQRPSMDVSILPAQPPFQSVRRMSTTSSIASMMSINKHSQYPDIPKRLTSLTQWSESIDDSSAPLRWDELFEMDPNSRGPLWLSGRGLGQIPHEFFDGLRNLRELYLDHNDIKVVPDSLLKLTKLDVLDLSCNSISSFHSAFKLKKLKNLRRLNLDHNMLTDISPIYKLKSLRELRMNHNLVPFVAMAIQTMTKLKILSMESNTISALPETIGKLGNLCELRLSDNNLRILPDSIGSLRTLQVLALRSNMLEKLPESWKDMENLSTLDLACNCLTVLPADIVRLPRLTHLDLHDNQIQTLPEKIGQLSNLVVLQLCNNQLRELPKDIGRLRDLHDLVLSFNQLHLLPDEIGKLTKLQELKFNNNPLRTLPKTIQRLTNVMPALDQMNKLEEFFISNNFLREIGTSSLNLQSSTSGNNLSYTGPSNSGTITSLSGLVNNTGPGSLSGAGQTSTIGTNQAGNATTTTFSTLGAALTGNLMMSGGLTASKLSELKRLRVFEARGNQIRILTPKIKMLPSLEVLDLEDNLLSCLPKEVGDLVDLKVLILEGNPIKSLPSSLTKLMGTLEVFRIGEWPENGFEIAREQPQVNMKINVLQSFLPQQIERTLLFRMHDCILKRIQELDSQHDQDKAASRTLTTNQPKPSGSSFSLASNLSALVDTTSKSQLGLSQGLAIAAQNMIANRNLGLHSSPSGSEDLARLTVNSEGINPSYVENSHSNFRNLPALQLTNIRTQSVPITTLPLTTSPQSITAPTGPMSSFPLLNSLRPRKSQHQLTTKNLQGQGSKAKTMYASPNLQQQDQNLQQESQIIAASLTNRVGRAFDFTNGQKVKNDIGIPRVATLETSRLQLSTDAMIALGLGTQPGSAGSVIAHSNGTSRLGDGSLSGIKASMGIKSTPSLTSMPVSFFPPRSVSPAPGSRTSDERPSRASSARSGSPLPPIPTPLRRSSSTLGHLNEAQNSEKPSASTLAWLRLKSPAMPFTPVQDNNYQQQQQQPDLTMGSSSIRQPISAAPPPIFLDYDFGTPSLLDIPQHLYYSAGDDDVDGDHPGLDGETEDDRSTSTTTGGGGECSHSRNKGKGRMADTPERVSEDFYTQWQQSYNFHPSNQLNTTDPVLKIAVLKGIYDQILQNMDHLVEQSVQESPAKKNNRFKLLNTLRFLKADRGGSGSLGTVSSGYHPFPAMMQ